MAKYTILTEKNNKKEAYTQLKYLCILKKWKWSTLRNKKYPFEYGGYLITRLENKKPRSEMILYDYQKKNLLENGYSMNETNKIKLQAIENKIDNLSDNSKKTILSYDNDFDFTTNKKEVFKNICKLNMCSDDIVEIFGNMCSCIIICLSTMYNNE